MEFNPKTANELASAFLRQTKGGTNAGQVSSEVQKAIYTHLEFLIDMAFRSKSVNYNAYGVRRMLISFAKAKDATLLSRLKTEFDIT